MIIHLLSAKIKIFFYFPMKHEYPITRLPMQDFNQVILHIHFCCCSKNTWSKFLKIKMKNALILQSSYQSKFQHNSLSYHLTREQIFHVASPGSFQLLLKRFFIIVYHVGSIITIWLTIPRILAIYMLKTKLLVMKLLSETLKLGGEFQRRQLQRR